LSTPARLFSLQEKSLSGILARERENEQMNSGEMAFYAHVIEVTFKMTILIT
jgi:hypothetical protein